MISDIGSTKNDMILFYWVFIYEKCKKFFFYVYSFDTIEYIVNLANANKFKFIEKQHCTSFNKKCFYW